MKLYATEAEARDHPEEGKRLYRLALNGKESFAWAKNGSAGGLATALLRLHGGTIRLVDRMRDRQDRLDCIMNMPTTEALAELDRLREQIKARQTEAPDGR